MSQKTRTGAGAAYLKLLQKDPESVGWQGAKGKIRALSQAVQEVHKELVKQKKVWQEKYDEPWPDDFEDVNFLLARAGFDPNFVLKGNWTFADVWPILEGYLQRLQDDAARSLAMKQPEQSPTHSADFTSINWFRTHYTFSKGLQAECIRVLWEAWESGHPALSELTIGQRAGSGSDRFRLVHVFCPTSKKTRKRIAHPSWNNLIIPAGKGSYQLAIPSEK